MILTFSIPDGVCQHDRHIWQPLAEQKGIDFEKKVLMYRDFANGRYVILQEVEDCFDVDNSR